MSGAAPLRAQGAGTSAERKNLVALLLERAREPGRFAATHKVRGRWEEVTWGEVLAQVRALSAALVARGVKPGDRVALFAATQLRWVVCDLAISAARAITVPLYPSSTPDEARYILRHSGASLVFVDDDVPDGKQPGRATRLRQIRAECPALRELILFDGAPQGAGEGTLAQLWAETGPPDASAFEARALAIGIDDSQSILYTSGTTGDPKGVVLTHGNWAYEAWAVSQYGLMYGQDAVLLFLPLAHAFAQVVKAAWLGMGFRLQFAESTDKLIANVAEVKPSILPAVPRIFEKIYNGVVAKGGAEPGMKGRLFRVAMRQFDAYVEARLAGRVYRSAAFELSKRLVFSKLKARLDERLGGRLRLFISGGAPLATKIAYFFELLGFEVLEGYGLTETSAAATVNPPGAARIGTVGPPLPGVELRIAQDGEILLRGPNVMRGYHENAAATAEVLTPDGWFHTGDIGELDAAGYLRITDRKKDLIVTAGGKNVAPQNLENALKASPLISQVMVHGDRRAYLTALVTVSEEAARTLLGPEAAGMDYAALARSSRVRAAVQAEVDALNQTLPSYSTLKRFAVLEADFTQESGELTPSLKVKRKLCTQKYARVLDGLYDGDAAPR